MDPNKAELFDFMNMFSSSHKKLVNACKDYSKVKFFVPFLKIVVTGFITVANVIAKKFISWLIDMMSYKSATN